MLWRICCHAHVRRLLLTKMLDVQLCLRAYGRHQRLKNDCGKSMIFFCILYVYIYTHVPMAGIKDTKTTAVSYTILICTVCLCG